jgi:hypothetical protein
VISIDVKLGLEWMVVIWSSFVLVAFDIGDLWGWKLEKTVCETMSQSGFSVTFGCSMAQDRQDSGLVIIPSLSVERQMQGGTGWLQKSKR